MGNKIIKLFQSSPTAMKANIGAHSISVDRSVENGGGGEGLLGGEYLLIGIGGCFCSTLLAAGKSRNIPIKGLTVDVAATLSETNPQRFTEIQLDISCEFPTEKEVIQKLIKIAEVGCISINTIKTGLNFSTKLNNEQTI